MMIQRAMLGEQDKELVINLFMMGFKALNNSEYLINYHKYIYSAECVKSAKALGRYLKFAFVKPLTGITKEDVNNEIFKTTLESKNFTAVDLQNHNSLILNKVFLGLNDYLKENTISSLVNNKYGSIQLMLSIDKEACLLDGIDFEGDWDLRYVYQPLVGFVLPYWLNAITPNQFIVNHESKPDMTVEDVSKVMFELGMSYDMDNENALFKEAMSYVMIDDVEGFDTSVKKEWIRGNNLLAAIEKDDMLLLDSLLKSNPGDIRMDFPQCNSLVSLAVKLKAENCLDVLMSNGASLWRSVGALDLSLSIDSDRSVFGSLLRGNQLTTFAEYVFFIEYMKKEAEQARLNKKEIPLLKEKVNFIVYHLSMEKRWDKDFFCNFVTDFVYSVLIDNEAHECIISNYFCDIENENFKIAVQNIAQKDLLRLIEKNFKNLLFLYNVTKYRSLPANTMINGQKIGSRLLENYNIAIPMVQSVYKSLK